MNPQLVKAALSDAKASAEASHEVATVGENSVRVAAGYIQMANANIADSSSAAIGVKTLTIDEYRAMKRQRKH